MGHQETRSAKRPQRRTTGDFSKEKTLHHLSLCQQRRHSYSQFEELEKMRAFLVFALAASATAQLKFGSDPTEAPKKDVNTRLGLLGTSLGLSPTAEQTSGSSSSGGQSSASTQGSGQTPTGRVPSEASLPAASAPAAVFPSASSVVTRLAATLTTTMTSLAGWGKNEVDGSFQFIQH